MGHNGKKPASITNAAGLKKLDDSNDMRVVMPKAISSGISAAIGGKPTHPLVYSESEENKKAQFNWFDIDEISSSIANVIAETGCEFEKTIMMIKGIGHVEDAARFKANVDVAMADLERFTDEFLSVKKKHEGRHGFITNAEDRMLYLATAEDYRALGAFFQGTMHHKLIEFTEYALNAKDAMVEAEKNKEAAQSEQPQDGAVNV